jgi:SAM-dependent methyltransferase
VTRVSDDATGWFERLYAGADGDPRRIPWARGAPHRYVTDWLDQPGLDVTGVDAVVVGCGLGDEAADLARRGCRVTAFDVSPTAVEWARRRFPDVDVDWRVVDLFDLPDDLLGAFGLVVEVRTVQSLPADRRDEAMHAVAALAGPGGYVVATLLLATSDTAARSWSGPPWALAPSELATFAMAGLERDGLDHPTGQQDEPAMEVRLVLHRPVDPGHAEVRQT